VLAAFVNAASLVIIAFFILFEAVRRLYTPAHVEPRTMMWVAACGVVMNGAIALMLMRTRKDLNLRSAFVHELGDTLSTAAVIVGGWVILATGQVWIDSALSLGIGALVLWSSFGIIRESLNILLEGTPRGMNLENITAGMCTVEGVIDVHDLHVWSIGSETHALSCHVRIADLRASESESILRALNELLAHDFQVHHTTIQFEHEVCEVAHGCVIPVSHSHSHEHS
jgi:cobalt-zinc-cadmium efflux system protein